MAPNSERLPWTVQESALPALPAGSEVELELLDLLRHLPGRRSVWRAQHEGRDLLLKAYDVHSKQARDADREWTMAKKLANAGLKVAKPLFNARHDDGRLGVAFTFLPNGETLHTRVDADTLHELFQLVAAQHDAGFYQTDNHLGNYLATGSGLVMLDAGTCQSASKPLTKRERVRNLAILCATIPLRKRSLMHQALSGYFKASRAIEDSPSVRGLLARATRKAVDARLRRYEKKTRRTCTEFVHEEDQGRRWWACRHLEASLAEKLREHPNAFFDGQPLLKDGNTCTVVRLTHEGSPYVLKRYNPKGLGYRLRHALTMPRALRSWSHGHALRSSGVATPRPMACYLIYDSILLREAYLLMEEVVGVSLHESPRPETMASAYASLREELQLLHATHGDMKASNFIAAKDDTLTLIDLDSFCFHRTNWSYQHQAKRDRERFLKNWRKTPSVLAAFRDA
jgi:tRNA A-37 threonylcarbamoyl transferase component Bud32